MVLDGRQIGRRGHDGPVEKIGFTVVGDTFCAATPGAGDAAEL